MTDSLEPLSEAHREAARTFAILAQGYCEFIQNHERLILIEFARECARQLALLYAAALNLPDVDMCDIKYGSSELENLGQTWHMLQYKLGPYDYYWQVFDPHRREDAIQHGLLDDLPDIYRDLERGLCFYNKQTDCNVRQAIWEWRFGHQAHWGKHTVGALSALHDIIQKLSN
jgi:hypothetical protein